MTEAETISISEKPVEDCREVSFVSDNFQLKGYLHMPLKAEEPPIVIGVHGLFSDASSPKQIELAKACNAYGIAYLRFDHRGCGQSEGIFREVTTFEARVNDLASAVHAVRERNDINVQKIGLFGSSMGGAAVLYVAKRLNVAPIITFAAPLQSAPVSKAIEKRFEAENDELPLDPARIQFNIATKTAGLQHILIFHGDSDKTVPPSEAHRIYEKAVMPKRLILLMNGDHRMSRKENQDKFYRESVAWYRNWFREGLRR